MSLLRTSALICFLLAACAASLASQDVARTITQHSVWIKCGLKWEHIEGDSDPKQTFAGATVLYFGGNGKFAMVRGLVFKRAGGMMISEGDGEADSIGLWTVQGGTIQLSYRLVSEYKIAHIAGQPAPKIPGPEERAEIRVEHEQSGDKRPVTLLLFQGNEYEIARGLPVSEMKDRLEPMRGLQRRNLEKAKVAGTIETYWFESRRKVDLARRGN